MAGGLRRVARKVRSRLRAPAPPETPSAVETALVPGSKSVYFLFGGWRGMIGLPPYEFRRVAADLDAHQIYIRDVQQSWYQRGLPEAGPRYEDVDAYLLSTIERLGAENVRFIGNSMGGFAALLFCARLRRGRALAFAPQTFIDPEQRAQHDDTRWEERLAQLYSERTGDEILDVGAYIRDVAPDIEADVYVALDDALDLLHANTLADLPNVTIHRIETGGHAVVRALRDSGELARILAP